MKFSYKKIKRMHRDSCIDGLKASVGIENKTWEHKGSWNIFHIIFLLIPFWTYNYLFGFNHKKFKEIKEKYKSEVNVWPSYE